MLNRIDKLDPEYGFYRLYNYNFSLQASTIIYGRYEAKKKTRKVQAIRHTITPTVSFSYAPDFSKQKYGYVKTVQSDTYFPQLGAAACEIPRDRSGKRHPG